jgi:hypothetical protein
MPNYSSNGSTAGACGAATRDDPSRHGRQNELPRCECCDAVIPSARQFSLEVSSTPISCIVCGHQNDSYACADGELKAIFASPSSRSARKAEI